MANRIQTQLGDVLILQTTQSYTIYAVGRVSKDGQQDFGSEKMSGTRPTTALLLPGRKR